MANHDQNQAFPAISSTNKPIHASDFPSPPEDNDGTIDTKAATKPIPIPQRMICPTS